MTTQNITFEDNYPSYVQETFGFRYDLDHLSDRKKTRLYALRHNLELPMTSDKSLEPEDDLDTLALAHGKLRQEDTIGALHLLEPLLKASTFHPDVAWDEIAEFVILTHAKHQQQTEADETLSLAKKVLNQWPRALLVEGAMALWLKDESRGEGCLSRYIEQEDQDTQERMYEAGEAWHEAGYRQRARHVMLELLEKTNETQNLGLRVDVELWLASHTSYD